jgi:hypothetical protein
MRKRVAVRLPNGGIRMEFEKPVKKKMVETASTKPVETATLPTAEPKHVGGGWYELSDGRRVRKSELECDEGALS